MVTRLVEFENDRHITIRGILVQSSNDTTKTAMICVAGFEGLSSTAPKFVHLTRQILSLPSSPVSCIFRYDPTGIGLSDGEYHQTSINTLVDDLAHAVDYLRGSVEKFIFIAHSLGSCVISRFLCTTSRVINVEKIILLAPGLNQYDLHRYWFMQQTDGPLTWSNFVQDFQETKFQDYLNKTDDDQLKSCRAHQIRFEFIRSCSQEDFSSSLKAYDDRILHVHGTEDAVVPIESVRCSFKNTLRIDSNDHDLERPDILQQWTSKAIEFVCNQACFV